MVKKQNISIGLLQGVAIILGGPHQKDQDSLWVEVEHILA